MSKMQYFITKFQKPPSAGGSPLLNLDFGNLNLQFGQIVFFKLIMTRSNLKNQL